MVTTLFSLQTHASRPVDNPYKNEAQLAVEVKTNRIGVSTIIVRTSLIFFTFVAIYTVGNQIEKENKVAVLAESNQMQTSQYEPIKPDAELNAYQLTADKLSELSRTSSDAPKYYGAVSKGPNWTIRWAGPGHDGVTAIEAIRALAQHLQHVQLTDYASTENSKLQVHLIKAIEEFDKSQPTIGGPLNDLIPK